MFVLNVQISNLIFDIHILSKKRNATCEKI